MSRIRGAHRKEPATQQWIAHIAEELPGAALWDIGANIGLFTLLAGKLGLKVVAFEPLPSSQQMLQMAISLNGINESVVAIPIGLSDRTQTMPFYIRSPNAGVSGSSMGVDIKSAYRISTLTMAGDDISDVLPAAFACPTAVKIDVDGIELEILEDLRRTLKSEIVQHLMVEEHVHGSQVSDFLRPLGFSLVHEENTAPRRPTEYVNRFFRRRR